MKSKRPILGYDLNERYVQISYYDNESSEPVTQKTYDDNYQIPLVLGRLKDRWVYGAEAKKRAVVDDCILIDDLLNKAINRKKVHVGTKVYSAMRLLAKFIQLSIEPFGKLERLTFSLSTSNIDITNLLKSMARYIKVDKERISVQDYRESFFYYMLFQPKELWQYEAALFYSDESEIKAYMLRKLSPRNFKKRDMFVTVEEVSSAKIQEMQLLATILPEDHVAKNADEQFKAFIQNVFEKKVVSSVYLTGNGFENEWYPQSLKVLCNGRRGFVGNNLYSKGACYSAFREVYGYGDGPVYLDETKLTQQVSVYMRANGHEGWYPIIPWGTCWYEADKQWEVLVTDSKDIEIRIESLIGEELVTDTIPMTGVPERTDYSVRLLLEVRFMDEWVCKLVLKDIGFGEIFPASDFYVEKEIQLGGVHGQFNSMSF